ncbi:MAG: hypothetical protein WC890_06755 [Candidatus Margulisiibacteriota bacterium]
MKAGINYRVRVESSPVLQWGYARFWRNPAITQEKSRVCPISDVPTNELLKETARSCSSRLIRSCNVQPGIEWYRKVGSALLESGKIFDDSTDSINNLTGINGTTTLPGAPLSNLADKCRQEGSTLHGLFQHSGKRLSLPFLPQDISGFLSWDKQRRQLPGREEWINGGFLFDGKHSGRDFSAYHKTDGDRRHSVEGLPDGTVIRSIAPGIVCTVHGGLGDVSNSGITDSGYAEIEIAHAVLRGNNLCLFISSYSHILPQVLPGDIINNHDIIGKSDRMGYAYGYGIRGEELSQSSTREEIAAFAEKLQAIQPPHLHLSTFVILLNDIQMKSTKFIFDPEAFLDY